MNKGKLIVLEGIDGSGKSAQFRRLCARLEKDGIDYNHIVFPRYDQDSSALIRMYLAGEFGTHPDDVNAYTASTFFAVDRFASYLDVDIETSLARMRRREAKNHTHADIHEQDIEYLRRCLRTAEHAAEFFGWTRIPFMKDGMERDVDEKNEEIYRILRAAIQ